MDPNDPFDPSELLGPAQPPQSLEEVWQRLIRDGQMALEALGACDNFAEVLTAINALEEPTRRAALTLAVVYYKRSEGMTDAEYQGGGRELGSARRLT